MNKDNFDIIDKQRQF